MIYMKEQIIVSLKSRCTKILLFLYIINYRFLGLKGLKLIRYFSENLLF